MGNLQRVRNFRGRCLKVWKNTTENRHRASETKLDKTYYVDYLLKERFYTRIKWKRAHIKTSDIPYDVAVYATPMERHKR